MLCENIKNLRKKQGLSQEELANCLNVVRQTVSKWETGLSVPDAEMLIRLAQVLDTTVSVLLGENVQPENSSDIQVLSARLEQLNEQFARQNENRRRVWRGVFFSLAVICCVVIVLELLTWISFWIVSHEASIGIIGGADGPTRIFVSSQTHSVWWKMFLVVTGSVAVVGLWKTRRS